MQGIYSDPRKHGDDIPSHVRGHMYRHSYGAAGVPEPEDLGRWGTKTKFMSLLGSRISLNYQAILTALFLPWCVFLVTYTALSLDIRYQQPNVAYVLVALSLLTVLCLGSLSAQHQQRKTADPRAEPKWYVFIFITSLIYWLLAVYAGNVNFRMGVQVFNNLGKLNNYPNVDPARVRGQMMMDAGKVTFAQGANLDLSKAMGFRAGHTYCVAPIVMKNEGMTHYDFWAVGVDCCTPQGGIAYHCGEFSNPAAMAGVRLMHEDERPFYRLAVQQAEAKYKINAVHPLFFTWLQDPVKHAQAIQSKAWQDCSRYLLCVFFAHLFLVICACLAFARLGHK